MLFQLWLDGTKRIVPRPDQWAFLVQQVHDKLGHSGIRMTHAMLRGQYLWIGMYQQVTASVRRYEVCGHLVTSVTARTYHGIGLPLGGGLCMAVGGYITWRKVRVGDGGAL